jgi:hypothetical protein
MSPNGPYAGPPSHPWSSGDSDEPYSEPADPWSNNTTASGPAPWAPDTAMGYSSTYHPNALSSPPPQWNAPPPPPRRNASIIAVVVVLTLLILGGLGTTAWLLLHRNDNAKGGLAATTAPATTATTAPDVAEPQPSEDARFVKKGECVRNEGSAQSPAMTIVPCASGTYQVLKRVDGRTTGEADAEQKCSKVTNYTKWYFYDSELDSLDFVLCLRER